MIVVVDSGIWISAMQFQGAPYDAILKAVTDDRVAVCEQMRREIVRILTQKFRWGSERVIADLDFFWQDAIRVKTTGRLTGECRDPNDEFILECAELAKATCIVTGDRDLLSLTSHAGISIVTAREYVSRTKKAE